MDLASVIGYICSKYGTVVRLSDVYCTAGCKNNTHCILNESNRSGIIRSEIPEDLTAVRAISVISLTVDQH